MKVEELNLQKAKVFWEQSVTWRVEVDPESTLGLSIRMIDDGKDTPYTIKIDYGDSFGPSRGLHQIFKGKEPIYPIRGELTAMGECMNIYWREKEAK